MRFKLARRVLQMGLYSVLLFLSTSAGAVLPPGAVEDLKKTAPEVIEARVLRTETPARTSGKIDVIYDMEVLSVTRSASGLQKGDSIQVRSYALGAEALTKGFVGPKVPPLLEPGWVGRVYLKQVTHGTPGSNREFYEIAAYGDSFEALDPEILTQDR